MKIIHDLLDDERGISTIEFTFVFFIAMLMIMSIYDVLKFQNDIGMVFYNEQIARHRIDLVKLVEKSDEIVQDFERELNEANNNNFFSSLEYSEISLTCYNSLDLKYSVNCGKSVKVLRFNYQVKRMYTDSYISKLLNLPVTFSREIYVVNDYFN